jgi:(S)-2-hydroxyglutarate dehydrogenase
MPQRGDRVDFCVIGGGIVGLATAMTLLERRPGARVVVLEKEGRVAPHQTGHNSGVIHAGIYYAPGSLKARLCKAGSAWTKQFCSEHGIPFAEPGKLIVATDALELERLGALEERAGLNGLAAERLDATETRRREPHIQGLGALFLPATGIVDYTQVSRAMAREIVRLGGELRLAARVVSLTETGDRVTVGIEDGEPLEADRVVACGGIQADRLARMAGVGDGFAMVPFRGEYYRLPQERAGLIHSLIYPVPDPALPFLGVHLTLTIGGGITVGPNAVLGLARDGYPKFSIDPGDATELARFPGFWRLARTQLRTGVAEQRDSLFKAGYLRRVRKYCPELTVADLLPEPAGIRAQALRADGTMIEDFLFRRTARQLHLVNAPSPAATSAMPIAAEICDNLFAKS